MAEAVERLGEVVEPSLADGHRALVELRHRAQVEIERLVRDLRRLRRHDLERDVVLCGCVSLAEGREHREREAEEARGDGGAAGLAKPEVEEEMRREAELPERGAVGALAALMRGQQIVGDARGERLRDEGGGAAVEAVEDGDGVVRGCAEHDARDRAELEAADLGEHVEPVARVGRIDREGARDDADFLFEAKIVH